ncbi:hypothetical protein GCM10023193_26500 [Planotetraspora kaengkrachanensis]|uniref:Uncharacterized protein n=1 Tax=Planotetraspora kaengkrachanensis TaxID=575193 RepID=A0A8J3M3D2_9ACTN|nr:hypothetical protein Pka01_14480 [Planotetraspora kaengkrachanensis]
MPEPRVHDDEVEAPDGREADRQGHVTSAHALVGDAGRQREAAGRPVLLCRALFASVSRYDISERDGRDGFVKSLLKIRMSISSHRLIVEYKKDFLRPML